MVQIIWENNFLILISWDKILGNKIILKVYCKVLLFCPDYMFWLYIQSNVGTIFLWVLWVMKQKNLTLCALYPLHTLHLCSALQMLHTSSVTCDLYFGTLATEKIPHTCCYNLCTAIVVHLWLYCHTPALYLDLHLAILSSYCTDLQNVVISMGSRIPTFCRSATAPPSSRAQLLLELPKLLTSQHRGVTLHRV